METKTFLWRAMHGCMVALAICLCPACSEDDPAPGPTPDKPDNGEVNFTIDLPGGSGSGTTSSPVAVTSGDDFNLEITQTSSYTDPNGQVITREPKASIALNVRMDTVVARDLASLTSVKDVADVKTTTSGTSPARHLTAQKLEIGGQEISLDLAYEVYTVTNSANRNIEMPYIRLNPAKVGSANTTEETPEGRVALAVSAVKVRPLAMSRAGTVTDSTMYEVEVRFNIGLESMNTKESSSQALEFSTTYVGIVETTTTLEDPKAELSYVWNAMSGTNSIASPFVQTKKQDMELWLEQTSVYTDEYLNRYTSEPKAKIKISAMQDTVRVSSVEGLTKLVETTGDVSGEATSATQIFAVGDKNISIDWSYEKAASPEGMSIDMPYYRLSPIGLKGISANKLEDSNTEISERNEDVYEITATFAQTVTAEGMSGDYPQSFEVEYVVTYIGAVEVQLVDVRYNRRYEWFDAHDNLALRACYIIDRELVYSNGETKTEEYRSGNYMVDINLGNSNPRGTASYLEFPLNNGEVMKFFPGTLVLTDDYNTIACYKTAVPDINKLSHKVTVDSYFDPQDRELFKHEYLGTRFGTDDPEEGWYVWWAVHNHVLSVRYEDYTEFDDDSPESENYKAIRRSRLNPGFTKRFYYFKDTDTIVDFTDMEMKRDYKVTVEETVIPEGPARIYKHECNAHYLGKDFYIAIVDTVYQEK